MHTPMHFTAAAIVAVAAFATSAMAENAPTNVPMQFEDMVFAQNGAVSDKERGLGLWYVAENTLCVDWGTGTECSVVGSQVVAELSDDTLMKSPKS